MPTTADYLTQLQNDKNTLVSNLNTKGVSASNTETFTTLVPKVLDIQTSGGESSIVGIEFKSLDDNNFPVEVETKNITEITNNFFRNVNASNGMFVYTTKIILNSEVTKIGNSSFRECSNLISLIINSDAVCLLNNRNAFTGTPMEEGTGYIYVPDNLVNEYKSATNWSLFANLIKSINDLEV